jgi:hypothetical protein
MLQIADALLSENAAYQFGEEQFAVQVVNDQLLPPPEGWVKCDNYYLTFDDLGFTQMVEFECYAPPELIAAEDAEPDAGLLDAYLGGFAMGARVNAEIGFFDILDDCDDDDYCEDDDEEDDDLGDGGTEDLPA